MLNAMKNKEINHPQQDFFSRFRTPFRGMLPAWRGFFAAT
jgi:hypothetical protein